MGACLLCRLPPLPFRHPQGGLAFSPRLPTLPLACFLSPIPPTPFPGGEGGALRLFYARGFAPCIPGVEPGRHWERGRTTRPAGAYFSCRLPPLPFRHPQGGLPSLPPAAPAISAPAGGLALFAACRPCHSGTRRGACLFPRLPTLPLVYFPAPLPRRGRISPRPPSPPGKGETKVFFMQGASPLASPGLNPWFAAKPIGSDSL